MGLIYVSDKDLAERFKTSRATIWRWPATQGFPKPVKLGPGTTRWRLAEVEEWETRQARYTGDRRSLPNDAA